MSRVTPLRQQYLTLKALYPDHIMFFRLGDFYETFDRDAETAGRELDLVVTGRPVSKSERIPMAGVPYHAVDVYIARLLEKGYRVAVVEQVSEPDGRGIVDREVSRVLEPIPESASDIVTPDVVARIYYDINAALTAAFNDTLEVSHDQWLKLRQPAISWRVEQMDILEAERGGALLPVQMRLF